MFVGAVSLTAAKSHTSYRSSQLNLTTLQRYKLLLYTMVQAYEAIVLLLFYI